MTEGFPSACPGSPGAALQIISTGGIYGAERVVLELAGYLAKQSWHSHVGAISSPGANALIGLARQSGLPTATFGTHRDGLLRTILETRRYIKRHRIIIAHSHGYKADLVLRIASLGLPVAKISTCHTWYRETLRMRVYEWLDKLALRTFERVIVVSPQLLDDVAKAGIRRDRMVLITNGIAVIQPSPGARQRVRSEFSVSSQECLAVRIGRLSAAKGNDVLLRSLARIDASIRPKVLLVGEGEERQALEKQVSSLELGEYVVFAGYRTDIAEMLAAADLFVIPSTQEGLPIVLLEAMSSGVPIVSTDVGAISLALRRDHNAWLVPAGDAEALADALKEAIGRPDLRESYLSQARMDFEQAFSREAMGAAYLEAYRVALAVASRTVVTPAVLSVSGSADH